MPGIAKFFGVISVIAGALCALIAIGYWFVGDPAIMPAAQIVIGAGAMLSGALVYCIGEITERIRESATHLAEIRRQNAPPPNPSRPHRQEPNLDRMKGVFADR